MDETNPGRPPHLDEQTAHEDPEGPGESKSESLRRIRRSVDQQRRREMEARRDQGSEEPSEQPVEPPGASEEPFEPPG